MIMKKIMFLLILFPTIFCSGCKKEDLTDTTNITEFSWKLKSIKIKGNKSKVKEDTYFNDKAYILVFENDSIFKLNTSVNLAIGNFEIINIGIINISNYQESTEVGGKNEIDDKLLQNIPLITSYQVLSNYLFFKGNDIKIEFEKEK